MPASNSPRRGPMRGFSLIEVMIAVLVLAIGMLGVAAMQATSLRNTQSAFETNQGVLHTYTVLDSMRANREVAIISGYNLTSYTCNPPARVDTPVSAADLAANDLNDWIVSLRANLGPSACGRIVCNSQLCTVSVRWSDSGDVRGTREAITSTVL